MTLYNQADSNRRKTWFLFSGFFIFVMLVGWVFSVYAQNQSILYFAVIFSVVSSFVSYWWSDKIVLMMSDAHELTHDNGREIYHLVENLCITAGLPLPKVYIINDTAPNAFATGRDAEHAVVVLTTGIISKLDKAELEGVIAHELSHIGNRDILLQTIVTVLVGVVVLLADWFWRWSLFGGRKNEEREGGGQLQLIVTVLAVIFALLAPLFAQLIQLAISRKREFLADASAALLTRHPDGLARALEKISADQEPLEVANRATAHLYITSPFKGRDGKVSWFAKLFMTHPPIEERVRALRDININ